MAIEGTYRQGEAKPPPLHPLRASCNDHQLGHFWDEFEEKSPDLFFETAADCKIGIVEVAASSNSDISGYNGAEGAVASWVSTGNDLDVVLKRELPSSVSRVFIVQRLNSWSRVNATFETFCRVCVFCRITPRFLNIVTGFVRKFSSKDEDFMACYSDFSYPDSWKGSGKIENTSTGKDCQASLCYNIRHFERHGRALEGPWSCRQSAIHQTYCPSTERSSWIVIQPPQYFDSGLQDGGPISTLHPLGLHIQYLAVAILNWRAYLDYIAEKLKLLNEQVAICKPYHEFEIDFSSMQQVHNLRQKLFYAHSILKNTANTLSSIGTHEHCIARIGKLSTCIHDQFQRELRNMSSELKNYGQTVRKLLSQSNDIRLMYDDILKFHGQELMHHNGVRLAQMAQADSVETKVMVSLVDKTSQDSRTMRIVTIVALCYLPANLVVSFFSTTLVWFESESEAVQSSSKYVLRVHQEIWIAALTTLILTATTFFVWSWRERREKNTQLELD
ncbi:hypothetical protein B0O99DRAFT_738672 [Bisporella sp. PMI_857]|nr:hypothetical protein B0O99DRAFT_738672 [Bisporella sp. PMI_857]